MQVDSLTISNFRGISNLSVALDQVSALLGSNNAGKSTILQAVRIFFDAAPTIVEEDFHDRSIDQIEITLRFHNFAPEEVREFGTAIIQDFMTVSRTFRKDKGDGHLQYSVVAPSYAPFEEIRRESNGTTRRTLFNDYARDHSDLSLALARTVAEADDRMKLWEAENPNLLEVRTIRGFFGAPNVANGKLKKKTSVHYLPAVADAGEETSDPRKSPILVLLAEISRQVIENTNEVRTFLERASAEFQSLTDPGNFQQLAGISEKLTDCLHRYYRDARLLASWEVEQGMKVTFPQPVVKIDSNGFVSGLQSVGHGLQRAALFSAIEFLSTRGTTTAHDTPEGSFQNPQSDIVLLIEEPEIYQHPLKQQVIYDAFHKLCQGFSESTGIRFQIVFTTHSEKFIGMNRFRSARIIRKTVRDGATANTCMAVDILECSRFFATLLNKPPLDEAAFEAKMHIFSRELCEGFFASKIVLVEGVSDRAVLEGAYRSLDRSPSEEGIAILSVEGKTKMDKPLYVFRKLGIPTFPVFDSDENKSAGKQKPETNRILQRIIGIERPMDFPDGCSATFCSYSTNLEGYLKATAGETWESEVSRYRDLYGVDSDEICKTPSIISEICTELRSRGHDLGRLTQIIDAVDQLQ